MKLKSFSSKLIIVSAFALCVLSGSHLGQTNKTENSISAVSFVRRDERTGIKPAAEEIPEFEKRVLALINQKRAENNLSPLAWSDEVAKLARGHSENMVRFKFFSHQDADGKSVDGRAAALGIRRWTAMGENIAYNRDYQNPCEKAVERWMLSPTHRANILNDVWQETAIGIAVADDGTFYFTQVFLKRR
ncbi:MAG TPA: CAP domain-containing protein [Pyrinomonadaceae bacterium]